MVVEVGDAVHGVDDEEDDVGLLDGQLDLLVDLAFEDVLAVDHPAAGVDNRKFASLPVHLAVLAVAGGAGGFVDNGRAAFGEAVEEGRLTHVGATYYGY